MTLAVFTSQLGTVSETFVRRHVDDIFPARTVAVARTSTHPLGGRWDAKCPVLFLDEHDRRLPVRLAVRAGVESEYLRNGAIARFLRQHRVTVVLGEYLDQFVDFVPLLDRLSIPYVVQGHGIDLSASLRRRGMPARYAAYRSARAVLTRCEFHRQRLVEIGLPADKIHVNPGGVDIPASVPIRADGCAKRFLAIGRVVPKKGPIYLLEAFRRAAGEDPAITLDYVGGGDLWSVRQFVEATGLESRVRLHKAASEELKRQLLEECGVFVQHSLTDPDTGDEEGLPASIQEAMAYGMAIISTRHSGIVEAVEHGMTGWLVDECDAIGMADAMIRAASSDQVSVQFGTAARKKAALFYSWDAERARIIAHLNAPEMRTEP